MPSWTIPVPTESGRAKKSRGRGLTIRNRAAASTGWNGLLGLANSYETREKITAPYTESGWIHACLKPIGQGIGSRKLQFWIGDPKKDKNAQLVPESHPIVALFARPNPLQTMSQFFEAGVMHRKLDGEDFWVLLDLQGKPVAIGELPVWILSVRGSNMRPKLNALGFPVSWTFRNAAGLLVEAPTSAVIQFKDYDPDDPVRGLGDVDACLSDIDLEWQATRYQRAILKHAGDPGGHIMIDAPLAPDEAEATENEANEKLQIDNAGRWTVVAGKNVKYEANKLSPRDMQFKELQMWLRDKIAGILGVPLPIIGVLDQATYSNMEQCVELFWKGGNGLCSYLSSVEDVVNSLFLPRIGDPLAEKMVARFDLSDIEALQEDEGLKLERAAKLASLNLGISLDEAMQLMGCRRDVSKMPFSGTRLVAGNLVPIQSVAGEDGNGLPAEPAADPNAVPGAVPGAGTPVQDTALNGAQVSSLLEIVAAVSTGTLTPEGAVALIVAAFPAISEEEAKRIVAGVNEKTPEPAPAAAPAGDPPPADDSGKAADPETKAGPGETLVTNRETDAASARRDSSEDAFAERRDYWQKHEAATLAPGESTLKKLYLAKKGWRRKYEAAQLARIRAFAETGKSAAAEKRESDELGTPDPIPRHVTEAEIEKLLLDRSEWAQKMVSAFEPSLKSIFTVALQDMADELDVEMLSATDPRVVRFLTNQVLRLSEDHTGTLAEKVRSVLLEQLSKASATGDLQDAVAEILPELTDALKQSFSDRESRALTIARTETAKASNGARFMQMQDAGVEESEWVTSGDSAVRGTPGGPYEDSEYSHAELDGKTAPIGAEYDHEKHPGLKHPSDPDGQPGDTINCRCASRAKRKD